MSNGSAAFKEMRSERMPQSVWADPDADTPPRLPDDDADRLPTKAGPTTSQEHGSTVSPLGEDRT